MKANNDGLPQSQGEAKAIESHAFARPHFAKKAEGLGRNPAQQAGAEQRVPEESVGCGDPVEEGAAKQQGLR
ncbi:hypothetical protein B296_00035010 [Ensete ventricosum]|uniref:Uncharacterized protein n=1 Tax=Ensete ventricosum TaxID=4639 RepID=A0A426ZYP3_ENSVE|nr:hypothetical protein B296_00035010 [Ensete ventricosum]